MTADIRRMSADDSLIKYHQPTVIISRLKPGDRPLFCRYWVVIFILKSAIIGRTRPTIHRCQNPLKSMESRLVFPFHLTDRRTTVILGNVIVIITCLSEQICTHKYLHALGIRFLMHFKIRYFLT